MAELPAFPQPTPNPKQTVDQADGYIAGSFEHGRVVQSEDRQTVISAFGKAAAAAEEATKRFEKAGNKASSRFYQAKAKALRKQMDLLGFRIRETICE